MFGPAYFLSGDSFLKRTAVEDAARQRLAPVFSKWIGREEIRVQSEQSPSRLSVSERVALLEKMIPANEDAGQEVLIGRSSGGRVATLFAMRRPVGAVICFAYPFRHPSSVLEPLRFSHLAHITVPTLIFQGTRDAYGAVDITENYALSPAVTVRFVNTDHDFDLSPAEWDEVARKVMKFLGTVQRRLPAKGARFDEAFYLRTHPDVAAAIAAGEYVSGEHHFKLKGRRKGRRFRLLAET
jgi:predicted alpha/beta-hydrolase family hydrolase